MKELPEELQVFLAQEYDNLPKARYVSIFVLRTTQSEAIFRTEGSGEECNRELVTGPDGDPLFRVVLSKRKQTAVERREGRKVLRKHNLLFAADGEVTDETVCSLNRNRACGKCIDCHLYGCAVGQTGSQKSRVITDDAFSLLPVEVITARKTFNAPYEDGTMYDVKTQETSSSINQDHYVVPGAHFLDIEVLHDAMTQELVYTLGNIMRSKRYGAITTRIGSVSNKILSIVGSDSELFSTLEWVNATARELKDLDHPQPTQQVVDAAQESIQRLFGGICGVYYQLTATEIADLLRNVRDIYSDEGQLTTVLNKLTMSYPINMKETS